MMPVHPKLKEYIGRIDPFEDVKKLSEKLDLREDSLKVLTTAQIFLKKCVKAGYTLIRIADWVYLDEEEEESVLSSLVK